jgi:UTP--glucose-1-phosphate uridylyltransferase
VGISGLVDKAVIVAAGWGTRFLPATKSIPKEMLPIIDKPSIHYVVKEAVDSGIKQIIIITASDKQAIEAYFKPNSDLAAFLESKGKTSLLKEVDEIINMVSFFYVLQRERKGLGHALMMSKDLVGKEPFAAVLPDDIIVSQNPVLKQMLAVFKRYQAPILAVEKIPISESIKYGIIDTEHVDDNVYKVKGLVEKPIPSKAPSDLGIVGRYILTPDVFDVIENTLPDKKGEIQLTDALQLLLAKQPIFALEFGGTRFDTGTPSGLIKAQIAFGLDRPQIAEEINNYIRPR